MQRISRRLVSTQYIGTNADEVLTMLQQVVLTQSTWSVVSMDGTTLVIREHLVDGRERTWTIPNTYWVVVAPDAGILAPFPPAVYTARYQDFQVIFNEALASTGAMTKYEVGAVALPALLLGGSTSIVVPLSGSMGGATYSYRKRAVSGVALLSMLTITETARSATSITFQVQAVGLASVAGILLVEAFK